MEAKWSEVRLDFACKNHCYLRQLHCPSRSKQLVLAVAADDDVDMLREVSVRDPVAVDY